MKLTEIIVWQRKPSFSSPASCSLALVSAHNKACSRAGKAGGFLAADWLDGGPTGPLTRRSFQLHVQLAEELGAASIGFRPVETLSLELADPGGEAGCACVLGGCACGG